MKKIIGIGLVLIILIVGVSFFINNPIGNNDGDDLSQQSVDYSENGISLSMPGNWVSAKSNSNETVLAVADPDAKDSSGFNSINVNIEKKSNFNQKYKFTASIQLKFTFKFTLKHYK